MFSSQVIVNTSLRGVLSIWVLCIISERNFAAIVTAAAAFITSMPDNMELSLKLKITSLGALSTVGELELC